MEHAESLVRWVGGKGRIADELSALFPREYGDFHEPFVGGGAMFLHEVRRFPDKRRTYHLSDANQHLVGIWQALQSSFAEFVDELRGVKTFYESGDRRENYLELRRQFNKEEEGILKAAQFYALVRLSFNGLVRYNKKGGFNAAFGGMSDPHASSSIRKDEYTIDLDRLRAIANVLTNNNVVIRHCDYCEALQSVDADDFAFLDPPYIPYGTRSIANVYKAGAFDANRLITTCLNLKCHFVLCNHDAPIWKENFKNHTFSHIHLNKKFTSSAENRRTTKEIFVSSRFNPRQTHFLGKVEEPAITTEEVR